MLCLLLASCSASTDHAANSASSADPTAPAPSVEHAGRTVATVPEEGSAPATTGFDSASDGEDPSDEAEVAPGRRLAEVAPDEIKTEADLLAEGTQLIANADLDNITEEDLAVLDDPSYDAAGETLEDYARTNCDIEIAAGL